MDLTMAIVWTIDLILDIYSCVRGDEPTWILVFCPLAMLVLMYWEKYFSNR